MSAAPRHFLDLTEIPATDLRGVIEQSRAMKAQLKRDRTAADKPLAGRTLAKPTPHGWNSSWRWWEHRGLAGAIAVASRRCSRPGVSWRHACAWAWSTPSEAQVLGLRPAAKLAP